MSIPRDTMINASWDIKKINSVYNYYGAGEKGIKALYKEVSQLVGFEPDYQVIIEWDAVGAIVEAIGGVYFDVPYNMDYHDQYQDLVIEQEKGYRKLNGDDAKGRVISRSVAQDRSHQVFHPVMVGNAKCFGHVQCDSIIMGEAKIESIPAITANSTEAQLIHEAAIGKIAGDQLLKLQTLGLTEEEAEDTILKGFLA